MQNKNLKTPAGRKAKNIPENLNEQGHTGNIKQNLTHPGHQQDR